MINKVSTTNKFYMFVFILLFLFFLLKRIRSFLFNRDFFELLIGYLGLDVLKIYKSGLWYLLMWLYRSITFFIVICVICLLLFLIISFLFSVCKFGLLYAPFFNKFYIYYTHYLLRALNLYGDHLLVVLVIHLKKFSLSWLHPAYFDFEKLQNWYVVYLLPNRIEDAIIRLSLITPIINNLKFLKNLIGQILLWLFLRFYIRSEFRLYELVLKLYTQFFFWVFDSVPMPILIKQPTTKNYLPRIVLFNVIIRNMKNFFKARYKEYKNAPTILLYFSYLNTLLIKHYVEQQLDLSFYSIFVAEKIFSRLGIRPFLDKPWLAKFVTGEYKDEVNADSVRYDYFKDLFAYEYYAHNLTANYYIHLEQKERNVQNLSLMEFLQLHNELDFNKAKAAMLFLTPIQCCVVICNSFWVIKLFKPYILKILIFFQTYF
jgi:hypothetical protein